MTKRYPEGVRLWSSSPASPLRLAAGIATASIVAMIARAIGLDPARGAVLIAGACALAMPLVRWVSGGPKGAPLALRAVTAGSALGVAVGGVMLPIAVASGWDMTFDLRLERAMELGIVAAVVAAPVGAALALLYLPLLSAAGDARRSPSHAGGEHVLRVAGPWLATIAFIAFLVDAALAGPAGLLAALVWLAPLAGGIGAMTLAHVSAARRRRWLARVEAGDEPGFRIVAREATRAADDEAAESILPLTHGARVGACDSVLVRVADPREATYREHAEPREDEPIALIAR